MLYPDFNKSIVNKKIKKIKLNIGTQQKAEHRARIGTNGIHAERWVGLEPGLTDFGDDQSAARRAPRLHDGGGTLPQGRGCAFFFNNTIILMRSSFGLLYTGVTKEIKID